MRTPTTLEERWSWWEKAIAGEDMGTITPDEYYNDIHCGFFKVRKFRWSVWPSKNAPWLPARVWMVEGETDEAGELLEDEKWFCEIDGKRVNPWKHWHRVSNYPITEDEWNWLTAMSPLIAQKKPPLKK